MRITADDVTMISEHDVKYSIGGAPSEFCPVCGNSNLAYYKGYKYCPCCRWNINGKKRR